MVFEKSYITMAGAALLTRATAGKKIMWHSCGCYEHAGINDLSDFDLQSLTSLNHPVALGHISSAYTKVDDDTPIAHLACECSNAPEELETPLQGGEALAFGVWAMIEGDTNPTLVVIAKTGSNPPTTFPTSDGTAKTKLVAIIDLSVTLSDNAESSIPVEVSSYALARDLQAVRSDLEDLYNEYLENAVYITGTQQITGTKNFNDISITHIYPNLALQVGTIGSTSAPMTRITTNELEIKTKIKLITSAENVEGVYRTRYAIVCGAVVPFDSASDDATLGTDDDPWAAVYAKDLVGVIPSPSFTTSAESLTCPVGSILLAALNSSIFSGGVPIGVTGSTFTVLTSGGVSNALYVDRDASGFSPSSRALPEGAVFKILNGLNFNNVASGERLVALVMRIQ